MSVIPLICSGLTVIPTYGGIIGMFLILASLVLLSNYRTFSRVTANYLGNMNWMVNIRRSFRYKPSILKKKLLIAAAVSILLPLFMHRTCLCFYNADIGYYNKFLGFGINTMVTRFFQYKKACPPGPPCHLYATIP